MGSAWDFLYNSILIIDHLGDWLISVAHVNCPLLIGWWPQYCPLIGWYFNNIVFSAGKLLRDVYIHYNITTNTLGLGCSSCHQSGVRWGLSLVMEGNTGLSLVTGMKLSDCTCRLVKENHSENFLPCLIFLVTIKAHLMPRILGQAASPSLHITPVSISSSYHDYLRSESLHYPGHQPPEPQLSHLRPPSDPPVTSSKLPRPGPPGQPLYNSEVIQQLRSSDNLVCDVWGSIVVCWIIKTQKMEKYSSSFTTSSPVSNV